MKSNRNTLAILAAFSAILFTLSPVTHAADVPKFIVVGKTYTIRGGDRITVLEIDPAGWIKVRGEEGVLWLNLAQMPIVKE